MKRLAAVVAVALLATGCDAFEMNEYERQQGECAVSDGRYEIRVDLYRDSDQPKESPLPDLARRLCAEIADG